jgi:hypothetical protein
MLIKMGLETLASDASEDVFNSRFDAARQFALTGNKSGRWWYIQHEDMAQLVAYSKFLSIQDWTEGIELSIEEPIEHAEIFQLRFLSHTFMVPLVGSVVPPPGEDLPEPEYRIFTT